MKIHRKTTLYLVILAIGLAACAANPAAEGDTPSTPAEAAEISVSPTPTTQPQPSPTPIEPAATVNGEVIPLTSYTASLARLQDARAEFGTILATDEEDSPRVLNDLIQRMLLAQAARQAGFIADAAVVAQRWETLVVEAGGPQAAADWLAAQHFTEESFRQELALEIEAAWMRAEIVSQVPETADQVLARQVLLYTEFEALRLLNQLENGTSFDTVVANNDPQGLGYLGWFPRGVLLDPELEQPAFSLQPGEYSQVIETRLGFHILEVIDRDPNRRLSSEARLILQRLVLESWLEEQYSQSQIEIFTP